MKQQIKGGIISGLTAWLVFTLFGVVYAAWNDDVTDNVDTLTAQRWNDLVTKVEEIENNVGFTYGSEITASLWLQVRTNTCNGADATLTIPESGIYRVNMSANAYRYSWDYNNIRVLLTNSSSVSVMERVAHAFSGGYMLIEWSELIELPAWDYSLTLYGSNASDCNTSSLNRINNISVTAKKLNW